MDRSKLTRIDDALLRQFAEGRLDSELEVKLAVAIEKSPDLQARVAAISSDQFLEKVKRVAVASPGSRASDQPQRKPAGSRASKLPDGIPQELIESPDYQVLKELGRGGMGVVYAAKYLPMDRMEVLKVLNPQMVRKESARQRFINEMKAIGKLNHPFIATAYQRVVLPTQLVFSMEYVPGRDLHKFIQKYRPIPVPIACTLASQIATALGHAHSRKMVHRDIKPSNVMVFEEDGKRQIKILDFGLAKATSEQQADGLTADGTMLGTPEYMAPEQALDAATADIRADIYSLGCTLYHLLAGKPPFTGTYQSVLMAHAQSTAPAINLDRPDVPVELAQIVAKMMAKEPSKRFQTPKAVVAALKPFIGYAKVTPSQQASEAKVDTRNHLASPSRDTSVETPASPHVAPAIKPDLMASLADLKVEDRRTRRRTKPTPRRRTTRAGRRKKPPIAGIVAGGLFAALIVFGIVFSLKTPDGTLVIENLPEDAQVLVDQENVSLQWNEGKDSATVRIQPGTRQVEVISKGMKIAGETVTIEGKSSVVFRVADKPDLSSKRVSSDPSRVLWWHTTGYFEQLEDGIWQEISPNGNDYYLREITRNDQYIEMDPINGDTNLRIRLYADRCDRIVKPELQVSELFQGNWHPLGILTQETLDAAEASDSPSPLFASANYAGPTNWFQRGGVHRRGTKKQSSLTIHSIKGTRFWGDITYQSGRSNVPITGIASGEHIQWANVNNLDERADGTLKGSTIHAVSASVVFDLELQNSPPSKQELEPLQTSDFITTGQIWRSDEGRNEFLVLDRDGEDFRARMVWYKGPVLMRETRGKIVGNQISWLRKDVRFVGNQDRGSDNEGQITEDGRGFRMDLQYNDSRRSGGYTLRLTESVTPPNDAVEYQGDYFKVISDQVSWDEARDACTQMGGTLVEINEEGLNQLISSLATQAQAGSVWIGASGENTDGDWQWINGKPLQYSNWAPDQPDSRADVSHHALMLAEEEGDSNSGQWVDHVSISAEHRAAFVCQWKTSPTANVRDNWMPLFNGVDLAGWDGDEALWSMRDGVVVGVRGETAAEVPSYLICRREFDDFELRCKIKLIGDKADTGVMFRSTVLDEPTFMIGGPQCNVTANEWCNFFVQGNDKYQYRGGGLKKADQDVVGQVVKRDEFNDLSIRCIGNQTTIWLNGTTMVDGEFQGISSGRALAFQLWQGSDFEIQIADALIRQINPPQDGE